MKEDYEEAMRQQQWQEEEKYKLSIQYQEELERQLEEQVIYLYMQPYTDAPVSSRRYIPLFVGAKEAGSL